MTDIVTKPIQPLPENEGIQGALAHLYAPTRQIQFGVDKSCDMAVVLIDGEFVMGGNFWDFYPGCHGINEYGDFNGYRSLTNAIERKLRREGCNTEMVEIEYKYGTPVTPIVLKAKTEIKVKRLIRKQ